MRTRAHDRRGMSRGRSGSALLAAVAMTMTIAMLSAILLQQSVSHLQSQSGAVEKKKALYLAEAGLAEGLASLRSGGSGNIGSSDTPAGFGEGAFWVETVENTSGHFVIHATGLAGGARASLESVIEPEVVSPTTLGLVGFDSVTIGSGATLEPYASSDVALEAIIQQLGDEALIEAIESGRVDVADLHGSLSANIGGRRPVPIPYQLVVASNGPITVDSSFGRPTTIEGGLTPGPEFGVDLGPGVRVSGTTAPSSEEHLRPRVEFPEVDLGPAVSLRAGGSMTLTGTDQGYERIDVGTDGVLRLVGPARIAAHVIDVASGARIEVDTTGGPVELYASGGVRFDPTASLENLDADPTGLTLFVVGDERTDIDLDGTVDAKVTLPTEGELHLGIIAPDTAVHLPGDVDFHGTAIAGSLSIGQGARIHFDNALLVEEEEDTHLGVISWKFNEIPKVVRSDLRQNLVTQLKLRNGGSLPSPTEAELPIEIGAVYRDNDGLEQIYRGTTDGYESSSAFDTEVEHVPASSSGQENPGGAQKSRATGLEHAASRVAEQAARRSTALDRLERLLDTFADEDREILHRTRHVVGRLLR